jgi:hypothetical protein
MSALALSAAFQNPSAPDSASSAAIRARLPSMSKMPPENLEAIRQLRDAFSQGPDFHGGEVYTRILSTAFGPDPGQATRNTGSNSGLSAANSRVSVSMLGATRPVSY